MFEVVKDEAWRTGLRGGPSEKLDRVICVTTHHGVWVDVREEGREGVCANHDEIQAIFWSQVTPGL